VSVAFGARAAALAGMFIVTASATGLSIDHLAALLSPCCTISPGG
jgi:hypothetical protein